MRLVDIAVPEDLIDSQKRGDVGRVVFTQQPECRGHDNFDTLPLQSDSGQRLAEEHAIGGGET
jgi:hypothetical protein